MRALHAVVAASLVGAGMACVGESDPRTGCGEVRQAFYWAEKNFRLAVETPVRCPVDVPQNGGQFTRYSARVTGDSHWVADFQQFDMEIQDATHFIMIQRFGFFIDNPPFVEFAGTYVAGFAGQLADINAETDYIYGFTTNKDFTNTSAEARLRYNVVPRATIGGPVQANVGSTVQFTSTVKNVAGPVTYRWYRDGALVGTGATLTQQIGIDASGTRQYTLTAADADSRPGAATQELYIFPYGGGGGGWRRRGRL